jgi:pepF/M3 family oligoendopeptidase
MNMRWSLDSLYTSFQSDSFQNDMKKVDEIIEDLKNFVKRNIDEPTTLTPTQILAEYIQKKNDMSDFGHKIMGFASLSSATDTSNTEAQKYREMLSKKFVELTESEVRFENWLCELKDLDSIIKASPILEQHRYHLVRTVEMHKYMLSEKEEVLASKLRNTGSTAWSHLQSTMSSTLMVELELDGKTESYPLPVIRNMAYDSNPVTRKKAYEAELKAYEKIEEVSAACLNSIKGEVLTMTKLRGYPSPLEMGLLDSDMDKATLDAMLAAMKESLPLFRRYLLKKAQLLGHKGGLPFYDLFAPMGSLDKKYTYEEARDYVVENFGSFSPELAKFAANAFEKQWIDAEPRKGKRGGAFCSGIHGLKECRILTNFNGNFNDVTTLAHELGHGYHGQCLYNETSMNSNYSMPLAETASTFCETIVFQAALKNATPEEAFTLLETSISDATQIIVDIYSRYLFESKLFEMREGSSLPVAELKRIMLEAQEETYGEGLNNDLRHPYMWLNKPHYYYAGSNFYNYPYAFGQLFAIGLYAEYLKRGKEFVPAYDSLLRATGKNGITAVAAQVGIDVNSIEFWRSSLDVMKKDIEQFLSL